MGEKRKKILIALVSAACIAVSLSVLLWYSFNNQNGYALLSALIIALFIIPFFISLEAGKPAARDIVPIAVLSAAGVAGRVLFAALPSVKPTTAIVIISGMVFGPQAGFLTGAVSAFVSNFFFGQGIWTPWQMLAWGLCGFLAGLLAKTRFMRSRYGPAVFGFAASLMFGVIMNCWHIIGFVNPITLGAVAATFAASIYFDAVHAFSTAFMMLVMGASWTKKLSRVKLKYGIMEARGNH